MRTNEVIMRNVEFSTSKGEFYLVDFPEGANRFSVFNDRDNPYISYFKSGDTGRLYVNYPLEVVGNPKELTEGEWGDICEEIAFGTYRGFINHQAEGKDFRDIVESSFKSATQSGISLLKANGVFLENQLGEKPEPDYKVLWDQEGDDAVQAWKEAQEKVYKNPMMFKIKE